MSLCSQENKRKQRCNFSINICFYISYIIILFYIKFLEVIFVVVEYLDQINKMLKTIAGQIIQ